ncbi:MAG: ATP synthase F1 subunit epsilon [Myxococcota bacterium]
MPLQLAIVTPERPVADLEVDSVVLPGAEGEFGVLPGHEALLAPVQSGVVRYRAGSAGGAEERLAVSGGFAEVSQDRVTLLARTAEPASEIDRGRAERALGRAEQGLRDAGAQAPPDDLALLRAAVARATARLGALQ